MPRVRHDHKLIRIPLPAWAAFQITFHYPAENDKRLIDLCVPYWLNSNSEFLQQFAHTVMDRPASSLTLRQRLTLLQNAYPDDKRLQNMRKALTDEKTKFAAEVRENPGLAYRREAEAVALAVSKKKGKISQEECPF